ncbi:hypothetical protein [Longirhabdus pacifica]|nr:hypothetical protein [Longirhabdus pacifica]
MGKINWKSQTAIEQEQLDKHLQPAQEEIDQAQRELETIHLLMEMGVIQ